MRQRLEITWLAGTGCAARSVRGPTGGSGLVGGSAATGGKGSNSPVGSAM